MTFRAAPHLRGLKEFQLRTVHHVFDRFYGDQDGSGRSGRFLVADETGLGKSIVARGVIARTVEHLEAAGRRRITVLYVCSNRDLAQQNIRRLNITGEPQAELNTRLSMLATQGDLLDGGVAVGSASLNLIPLTPATSLQPTKGAWRSGRKEERALLAVILERLTDADETERRAGLTLLRGAAGEESFSREVEHMRQSTRDKPLDRRIIDEFAEAVRASGLQSDFVRMRTDVLRSGARDPSPEAWHALWNLIAHLRRELARAGAKVLEPDLIVLDEFQRFRDLLAAEDEPGSGEDLELAHTLFNHPHAKILLLSATPYTPFTRSGGDDSHQSDFLRTIDFLNRHQPAPRRELTQTLERFRRALIDPTTDADPGEAAQQVREALLPIISRSERPPLTEQTDMVEVLWQEAEAPHAADFHDWIVLRRLGDIVGTHITADYWKSVPHFPTFMEGYAFGDRVRDRIADGEPQLRDLLRRSRRITRRQVDSFGEVDLGHGYLRRMVDQTVDLGWWKMLWLPPSMPYLRPGCVYSDLSEQAPTKRLIFSAWRSVPTAVACLLSYEAHRRAVAELRRSDGSRGEGTAFTSRLGWAVRPDGSPSAMNTLALFWPEPQLARAGDPLSTVREHAGAQPSVDEHLAYTTRRLHQLLDPMPDRVAQPWEAFLGASKTAAAEARTVWLRDAGRQGRETSQNWERHLARAAEDTSQLGWHDDLPVLAAFSPGSIARRCMSRVASDDTDGTVVQRAAWTLSLGLRNLFNRPETARILSALYGAPDPSRPYWRQVADYCADGGLESVLDEYLFQLACDRGPTGTAADQVIDLAERAVTGMSLRPAIYEGHDYTAEDPKVPFSVRYALRYGSHQQSETSDSAAHRLAEVRSSFNSPFAPFVLASTSVGQEGIDFHWWCHRVVHWNLPWNPVDFEQREGRVNRFGGHAVRKNVAHHHGAEALVRDTSSPTNPWYSAFEEAERSPTTHGAFSPWWIYPGPARIQRVLMAYPHSREVPRYEHLRDLLTHYRMTLGQPRQEDMIELLGESDHSTTIDLSPPGR
ncbi:MAG: helicase-related protein [Nesterenkonia sp.]|uniref:helicase-related protein n=1 Tax=Nesterenkonia marinintestina TaxID=2979865 RepID=UPI0021BEBC1E|nr:helicase-related protein [Nesterenkonia sp. GX14115]MDO5492629.1 helicase-related protein [Nesterenkonia sp.]